MTVVTFNQEQKHQEVQHKIGNWYKNVHSEVLYILVYGGDSTVNLVNTENGSRWVLPILVENVYQISQKEWEKIADEGFTLVPKINIQEV